MPSARAQDHLGLLLAVLVGHLLDLLVGQAVDQELVPGELHLQPALGLVVLDLDRLLAGERVGIRQRFLVIVDLLVARPLGDGRLVVALGRRQVGAEELEQGIAGLDDRAQVDQHVLDAAVELQADRGHVRRIVVGGAEERQDRGIGLAEHGGRLQADRLDLLRGERDRPIPGALRRGLLGPVLVRRRLLGVRRRLGDLLPDVDDLGPRLGVERHPGRAGGDHHDGHDQLPVDSHDWGPPKSLVSDAGLSPAGAWPPCP